MDSSMNKENDARSSQEGTAKRLSIDTSNTVLAARPVLQEIETLSNERLLIQDFGTSFQQDRKEITFVDIQSNVTLDPFFSPNISYDPLGRQSENFDGNNVIYSNTVEEDLYYSIEYMPETQSNYVTTSADCGQNDVVVESINVTFDTTETSRIFGMPSIPNCSEDNSENTRSDNFNVTFEKAPDCTDLAEEQTYKSNSFVMLGNPDCGNIEPLTDTTSHFSDVEKVKECAVSLSPCNLNATFENASEEQTSEVSALKNFFVVTENCYNEEMENKMKEISSVSGFEPDEVKERSASKAGEASEDQWQENEIGPNVQDSSQNHQIVESLDHFELEATTTEPNKNQVKLETANPDLDSRENIFNPFHISSDSITESADVEIKVQVSEIVTDGHIIAKDKEETNNAVKHQGAKESRSDVNNSIKETFDIEIPETEKEEVQIVAGDTTLETLDKLQKECGPEGLELSINKPSDELQTSHHQIAATVKSNEEAITQPEVLNISQVDSVNTDLKSGRRQTEESETEEINAISEIVPADNVVTEKSSIYCQIAEKVIPTVENDLESKKALEALSRSLSQSIDDEEPAIKTELETSMEQVLNKTIENFKEPVKSKVQCRPHIRSLRQKTQVIEHPLIVKPIHEGNVNDSKLEDFKEKEVHLKNELEKLKVELSKIQKENNIKDKCILANALAMEANKDVVIKYKNVVDQYQAYIRTQSRDLANLRMDTVQLEKEFSNMEMAFADVFNKYEKAKVTIEAFKENEDTLNKNIEGVEKQVVYMDVKYKELQNIYEQTVKQVQDSLNQERETNKAKLLSLRTTVKRLEIMASSLETALRQKTEECQALAAFCEDIGKM